MNKVKEPFKKELIYFDEKSYQKAVQEAEAKINILDDAIAFISDYVGTVNIKECLYIRRKTIDKINLSIVFF